nr:unnamed protein product [Callosobruchus analis]
MTHEQAVQFLRQCPEIVKLRLYRDSAQTPVATLSPSETTPRTSFSRKAHLRQEAVDMLNDLAGRKLSSMNHDGSIRSSSPTTLSPRRLRRTPGPAEAVQTAPPPATEYEQFHEGLLQKCSHPFDDDAFNSLFSIESDDGDKPSRPSSLDLYNPNQTPVAARKPRFNFSLAHNAYELNNLDAEVLDAPNLAYNLGGTDPNASEPDTCLEPASMPHIPLSSDCSTTFSHRHPAYQSAHPQIPPSEAELHAQGAAPQSHLVDAPNRTERRTGKKTSATRQEAEEVIKVAEPFKEEYEVLAIELNRGWNSRLGFSLQGAAGVTYVSAVHPDSVAAKDGRLKPGDRLVKVNDESIEHMSTSEIIDLLRIVRGPVCIVVTRVKSHEDCPKSNAEN